MAGKVLQEILYHQHPRSQHWSRRAIFPAPDPLQGGIGNHGEEARNGRKLQLWGLGIQILRLRLDQGKRELTASAPCPPAYQAVSNKQSQSSLGKEQVPFLLERDPLCCGCARMLKAGVGAGSLRKTLSLVTEVPPAAGEIPSMIWILPVGHWR